MSYLEQAFQYKPILTNHVEDAEFEKTYKPIVPSEGEIRLVANKNQECAYYYTGLSMCRNRVVKKAGEEDSTEYNQGFLPCKKLVDAHYRCITDDAYGKSLEEAPEEVETARTDFITCTFKALRPMSMCRRYFDEVLRSLYRMPKSKLADY